MRQAVKQTIAPSSPPIDGAETDYRGTETINSGTFPEKLFGSQLSSAVIVERP